MPDREELSERVEQLERELHDRIARANAAVAAAQDKVYWLDRWHLDLDALMRTRTVRTTFEALRWAKSLRDGLHAGRNVVRAARSQPYVESESPAHDLQRVASRRSDDYVDLVAGALTSGSRVLDFGCSSGALVLALREVELDRCDPNRGAIEPPLQYEDATFDAAFAIAIWSHLSPRAATAWLDEMRRLVKPNGLLVLTTQGEASIAHAHEHRLRSSSQLREIRAELYRCGYWYAVELGAEGDHGVQSVDWGTTFLSPAWLLERATPAWELALICPGAVVDRNQDLYVLRRR